MIMRVAASLMFVVIASCAGSSGHSIRGPDGMMSYRLKCHPTIAECWEEAGDLCPSGYHIVGQSSHPGGTLADWIPGPVTWYDLIVSCR
jgi:hypothetical protein